ncbi:MAG: glycosyltransferase [Caldilineaceae bacterium]
MTKAERILILTSKTGGGHVSLAESLRDRLDQHYEITIADPQPTIFHTHYRLVSRYALWLWGAEFKFSDKPQRALRAQKLFSLLVAPPIRSLLEQTQANLVITTYSFFSYATVQVIQSLKRSIPFVLLFSDAKNVHASWLNVKTVDAAFAPTLETQKQALAAGLSPDRVHYTGWPVRKQFYQPNGPSRLEMLTHLGLDPNRFTIFLQGGGEGTGKFSKTVENVLAAGRQNQGKSSLQVILAVGTNKILLERFSDEENVYVLPFTQEIASYMSVADVIMGKAGPNMLFEAVALDKPFIATTYIPGNEDGNLDFIHEYNLGWVALQEQKQKELVSRLSTNPGMLAPMREAIALYRQRNSIANDTILPLVQALAHLGTQ